MNAKRIHRQLSLESLETRTLLAGAGDLFGLGADLALAQSALNGLGDFSSNFSKAWGNKQLVITGTSATSLTIDLDRLPDFITNLKISSFASVTLLGTDDVDNLILKDVGSFNAAGLDVNVIVQATNVGALTLDSVAPRQMVMLEGSSMDLSVRSLTEVFIFSDLNKLKISSESPELFLQTGNDQQKIELTYRPELNISGMPNSSVEVRQPGSTPTPPPILEDNSGNPNPGNGETVGGGTDPIGGGSTNPIGGGSSEPIGGVETDIDPLPGNDSDPDLDPNAADPDTPSIPDEVRVIDFPEDERMRQFVADLRQFLRTAADDPRLAGVQLVGFAPGGSQLILLALADGELAGTTADVTTPAVPLTELLATDESYTPENLTDLLSVSEQFVADSWGSAGNALTLPTTELPVTDPLPAIGEFQSVNRAPRVFQDTPTISMATNDSTGRPAESQISEIIENVRALGGYLVERVSAEFTPGQQSMVLLVDPKPSRPSATSRNSALESFGSGSDSPASELLTG